VYYNTFAGCRNIASRAVASGGADHQSGSPDRCCDDADGDAGALRITRSGLSSVDWFDTVTSSAHDVAGVTFNT